MKMRDWGLGIMLTGLVACTADLEETALPSVERNGIVLAVADGGRVDSTLVFFFKKNIVSDSLVRRELIYDLSLPENTYNFILPAGYYNTVVLGNAESRHVRTVAPYSSSDILVEYKEGEEPPVIYLGAVGIRAGEVVNESLALRPVTSRVVLTIERVPADVQRIIVDLINTGAGIYTDGRYLDELTDPNLSSGVNGLQADSSYSVSFSCFPSVEKYGTSSLEVRAYDGDGKPKYSGSSSSFIVKGGERLSVSCSFQILQTGRLGHTLADDRKKFDDGPMESHFLIQPVDNLEQ